MKIGIVGIGRMGGNLALHLNDAGWNVEALYDIDPTAANLIAEQTGAVVCSTLADVTELTDTILTVVTDDAAMETIFAEAGDSLLANSGGKTFVNCATVTPATHKEVERRCNERGASSLEACMAGSIPQARKGTLYLMCAGKREVFDRVRPLLEAMSGSLLYVGNSGQAAALKALVNMLMNINTAGLAEALGLAAALGLELSMVRETFAKTGAASRVLETDGADMQNREYETYFSAEHAAKDSRIALQLAREAGLELPLARASAEQYERAVREGFGTLDKSAIAELFFRERRP